VQEEEDDRLGREGGLGRSRGRGPVGKGEKWSVEKKRKWAAAGPKGRMGRKWRKNSFPNKIWFLNISRLLKFAQGDLGGILTWGFFLNSSTLLKYFRKMEYVMPYYATLGKNN
jgi:hypothetical protein